MGSFYKNSDNNREQSSENRNRRFRVSDKSFKSATIVSSLVITILVCILFIIEKTFTVSEIDIQTICGITAGLCGFALAIPLFLKDFDITSNFWKQFYLIAITFLITTFIGIITFLLIDDLISFDVTLFLCFFLSIVISVNINNINFLLIKTKIKISLNPVLNLLIAYFSLFISLFFSKGNFWVYTTVLFTIYGFYLILTLMLSILIELFFTNRKTEDNDTRIKKAIQELAETYKNKALDEQILLDKLKSEKFSDEQEIISRTKVKDLVVEMNSETANNKPKITIFEYDKIIPRWTTRYDEIFKKTNTVIFIRNVNRENSFDYNRLKMREKDIDDIYTTLSDKMNLSKELLKENNCFAKYCFVVGKGIYKPRYEKEFSDVYLLFCLLDDDTIKEGTIINLGKYNVYDISYLHQYNQYWKNDIDNKISIIIEKNLNEILIDK